MMDRKEQEGQEEEQDGRKGYDEQERTGGNNKEQEGQEKAQDGRERNRKELGGQEGTASRVPIRN